MATLKSLLRGWRNSLRWSKSSTSILDGYVQESLALFDGQKDAGSRGRAGPAEASAIRLHVPMTVKLATFIAGGVILLVGAAGAWAFSASGRNAPVAAASPTPTATPAAKSAGQTLCDMFVSHLAQNLGKTASEVKTATANAVSQTADDAVAAGTLPKAQADRLKQQLAGPACPGAFLTGASEDGGITSGDDEAGGSDD